MVGCVVDINSRVCCLAALCYLWAKHHKPSGSYVITFCALQAKCTFESRKTAFALFRHHGSQGLRITNISTPIPPKSETEVFTFLSYIYIL